MIWAFMLYLSQPVWAEDVTERVVEAGEVNQEGCTTGQCFKDVNTTMLTNNRWAERELAGNIMETKSGKGAISNSDGAAVREK